MQKTNDQQWFKLNQKLYEIGIRREMAKGDVTPASCVTITTGEPQKLTKREVEKNFPDYYKMCKNGMIKYCPDVYIYYLPLHPQSKDDHCARLSPSPCYFPGFLLPGEKCPSIGKIVIPYSSPGNFAKLKNGCGNTNLFLFHEHGHIKALEKKGELYSEEWKFAPKSEEETQNMVNLYRGRHTLDCDAHTISSILENNGNVIKVLKARLKKVIQKNEEVRADFWGILQLALLKPQDTEEISKTIWRFAVEWLDEWTKSTPNEYFFKNSMFQDAKCMGQHYHLSAQVRFAAIKEFRAKFLVLLKFLIS